jgi:II/X family phage/plasmid replication protein
VLKIRLQQKSSRIFRQCEQWSNTPKQKAYDTSRYWGGETSRLVQHKCYLKHDEFMAQFEDLKQQAKKWISLQFALLKLCQNQKLIDWTIGLLRFESRLKSVG